MMGPRKNGKSPMDVNDILSSDPEVVSGAVVFKGTRVPLDAFFENLAGGVSLEEFLEDFPTVERAQAEAALLLASDDLKRLLGQRAA